MKVPAGANEGGFLTFVTLIVIVVSAAICEAGNVMVKVDELNEHDTVDEVGADMEQVDDPEATTSEGNIIINIPDAYIGEG